MESRFHELVKDYAGGKKTVFAKMIGVPKATFFGYLDGRNPKMEHLLKIRETFGINLDWLLTGEGPKQIDDLKGPQKYNFPILENLDQWLTELVVNEPYRRDWFKGNLQDAFPMFKAWMKRREEQEGRNNNSAGKNIA